MTASGKRTACTFCKKRKIKCDKQEPCNSCTKYKNTVCEYDVAKRRKPKKQVIETELDLLKSKISKLEAALDNNSDDSLPKQCSSLDDSNFFANERLTYQPLGVTGGGKNFTDNSFNISPASVDSGFSGDSIARDSGTVSSNDSMGLRNIPSTSSSSSSLLADIFKQRTESIIKNSALDPELVQLLNGREFKFNAFQGYSNTYIERFTGKVQTFGIFGWQAYFNIDPSLVLIWKYVDDKINSGDLEDLGCGNRNDGGCKQVPEQKLTMSESVKDSAKTLGLNTDSDYGADSSLITKIEGVLPNKYVIWKLIENFFKIVYPAAPFIDEGTFKTAVSNLIGEERTETKAIINYNRDVDYAVLGILLTVLRFSYLTLFSTNESKNEAAFNCDDPDPKVQEKKYLLNHPINVECILFSQQCLNKFNLFNVSSLWVVQLLLLTYIYRTKGPEYGLEPNSQENNNMLALLFSMCRSLGLHRDPDTRDQDTAGFTFDEKAKNISRKIWHYIKMADLMEGFVIGNQLIGSTYGSDTKVPSFTKENSNLADHKFEEYILRTFGMVCTSTLSFIQGFLSRFLDVNMVQDIEDICKDVTVMENVLEDIIGSTSEITADTGDYDWIVGFDDLIKCKVQLSTLGSNVSVYFHLYNYFDKRREDDLSFYFLKKIFYKSFPSLSDLYRIVQSDNQFLYIAIASMEVTVQKNLLVVFSLMVRLRLYSHKYQGRIGPNELVNLEAFKAALQEYYDYNLKFIDKFCSRFYCSWFIKKTMSFVMKIVDEVISGTEPKYLGLMGVVNLNMFNDIVKIQTLTFILNNINQDLNILESSCTDKPQQSDVDDLWLYLSSMNQSVDSAVNINVLDNLIKELDNINPTELGT